MNLLWNESAQYNFLSSRSMAKELGKMRFPAITAIVLFKKNCATYPPLFPQNVTKSDLNKIYSPLNFFHQQLFLTTDFVDKI